MTATLAPELTYVTNEMWVEALRSGKYQQTRGTLAQNDLGMTVNVSDGTRFCCLGVQAKIAGAKTTLRGVECELSSYTRFHPEDLLALDIWSDDQRDLLETLLVYPYFADLNDTVKASFEQIADVIEQVEPIA